MKRTLAHLVAPPSDYRQNFAAISSPAVMTTLMFFSEGHAEQSQDRGFGGAGKLRFRGR